jgi:hypothetical protein
MRRRKDVFALVHQTTHYRLRLRFPDRRERLSALTTRRPREIGDFVNLPIGPTGESRPGKGHVWRVTSTEDDGQLLVLDYADEAPTAPKCE